MSFLFHHMNPNVCVINQENGHDISAHEAFDGRNVDVIRNLNTQPHDLTVTADVRLHDFDTFDPHNNIKARHYSDYADVNGGGFTYYTHKDSQPFESILYKPKYSRKHVEKFTTPNNVTYDIHVNDPIYPSGPASFNETNDQFMRDSQFHRDSIMGSYSTIFNKQKYF